MRIIDADELIQLREDYIAGKIDFITEGDMVAACKTIDAVPVVRCEHCKHSRKENFGPRLTLMCGVKNRNDRYYESFIVDENHFCGYGERKG